MSVNYAWENLYGAVRTCMRHQGTLQERLHDSYAGFHVLKHRGHLPDDLQPRFDAMMAAWSRDPDPGGTEGTVPVTLRNMSDDECLEWIDEILSLYGEVVERQAKKQRH